MFAVRKAVKKDFPRIHALDVVCEGVRLADGEHTWREWIAHAEVWVAERGRKLLGAVVLFPTKRGDWHLHKIFVRPRYRHRGIGSALLAKALPALRGKRIFLTVYPGFPGAVHLYKKFGFRIKRLERGYYRKSEPRYVMERA
ncbi:MAG: GNAT family N-acetyltransferase [Candidatus Micrarchaeia archaeon]